MYPLCTFQHQLSCIGCAQINDADYEQLQGFTIRMRGSLFAKVGIAPLMSIASLNCNQKILNQICRYIASKYHYFGVGGGVEVFQDFVAREGVFHVEEVFATDESMFKFKLK